MTMELVDFERLRDPKVVAQARKDMASYLSACAEPSQHSVIETHLSIGLEESPLVEWMDVDSDEGLLAILKKSTYQEFVKRRREAGNAPSSGGIMAVLREVKRNPNGPKAQYIHLGESLQTAGLMIDSLPIFVDQLNRQLMRVAYLSVVTVDELTHYCEALFAERELA